jgi:hypothetical protein
LPHPTGACDDRLVRLLSTRLLIYNHAHTAPEVRLERAFGAHAALLFNKTVCALRVSFLALRRAFVQNATRALLSMCNMDGTAAFLDLMLYALDEVSAVDEAHPTGTYGPGKPGIDALFRPEHCVMA